MKEISKHYVELEIKEINHDVDHVHILISIPPKYAVGKIVGMMKRNTSTVLRRKFDYIKKAYEGIGGIWSDGYFVSTVGINEEIVQQYIEHQGKEDSAQSEIEFGK